MEIIKDVHDLVIVLGFTTLVIIPRAVLTYLAVREEQAAEELG